MIPNLINTIIGIWLVYLAVLNPARLGDGGKIVCAAGIAVLILGFLARASDHAKWFSSTNISLGVILLLTAASQLVLPSEAITFWMVFWVGLGAAMVSLWAVLYRPQGENLPQN